MAVQGIRSPAPIGLSALAPSFWRPSWPLLVALYVYLLTLYQGNVLNLLLLDGDTYWHIAAGQWILHNGVVPTADPFSHTMPGAPWTAHEWLSEVVLALAHDHGGWTAVVALTGLAFAASAGLLMRALLAHMQPVRALMLTVMAVLLTVQHLLARPHMIALPFMMLWMIGLVQARDRGHTPSLWLLPVMVLWANLHGGFTLGIAFAGWFALEAVAQAWGTPRMRKAIAGWGLFVALAAGSALLTPHGPQAFIFTWQVLMEEQYALSRISEWASPNFHAFQPLQLWLLGGLALALYQGLRLPVFRLVLLLGLLHLSLKHVRYIELLGLLGPLVVAKSFGEQWAASPADPKEPSRLDRLSAALAGSSSAGALVAALTVAVGAPLLLAAAKPLQPPAFAAPQAALQAARDAGVAEGHVLNAYGWGGYLIYSGIPVAIDGRADMYREAFLREFLTGTELTAPGALDKLLDKYRIGWTLLPPETPAVSLLDRLPGWQRIHSDTTAVVHARKNP
ncbi:hypothetical protein [Ramlibacter sp.]|uniref:hypothetical protein n=1 Tax=Ramlibacter sp. TaxID=1917967 RepID=UPI002D4C1AA8|nr:hypothetical protein [Ramlibacter sp.]HYD77921.1 hypothetical protein [Ramlibacter sp.]